MTPAALPRPRLWQIEAPAQTLHFPAAKNQQNGPGPEPRLPQAAQAAKASPGNPKQPKSPRQQRRPRQVEAAQGPQDSCPKQPQFFCVLRAFPLTFLRFVLELGGSNGAATGSNQNCCEQQLLIDQVAARSKPPSQKKTEKSEPKRSEKFPKTLFWSDLGASGSS